MIVYSKRWGGLPLVFRIKGTSWPYGILPALVAVAVGQVLGNVREVEEIMSDRTTFMDHPYPFQLYAFIIGFLMVFRTNFAYQRYWEGRGTIAQMASKWLDGACMSVAFDAPGSVASPYLDGVGEHGTDGAVTSKKTPNGAPSHDEFVANILHLFSLMHALALQHLRADSDLDNLMGFAMQREDIDGSGVVTKRLSALPESPAHSDSRRLARRSFSNVSLKDIYKEQRLHIIGHLTIEERRALEQDGSGNIIPTEARVTMVEGWIMRRLLARQKHEKCDMEKTSPPILSRLYQVISDGCIGFGQASKITETPFPFPYQNLLQIFLWLYVFTVPLIMNAWLKNAVLRGSLTFLAVWCYFALNQVGNNLEDPYIPYDPNEIALQHIQHSFNAKLLSFCPVPEPTDEEPHILQRPTAMSIGSVTMPSTSSQGKNSVPNSDAELSITLSPTSRRQTPPHPSKPALADAAPGGSSPSGGAMAETKLIEALPPDKQSPAEAQLSGAIAELQQSAPGQADINPERLAPLITQSLQELANAHARCLRVVGVLEGVCTRQCMQTARPEGEGAGTSSSSARQAATSSRGQAEPGSTKTLL